MRLCDVMERLHRCCLPCQVLTIGSNLPAYLTHKAAKGDPWNEEVAASLILADLKQGAFTWLVASRSADTASHRGSMDLADARERALSRTGKGCAVGKIGRASCRERV